VLGSPGGCCGGGSGRPAAGPDLTVEVAALPERGRRRPPVLEFYNLRCGWRRSCWRRWGRQGAAQNSEVQLRAGRRQARQIGNRLGACPRFPDDNSPRCWTPSCRAWTRWPRSTGRPCAAGRISQRPRLRPPLLQQRPAPRPGRQGDAWSSVAGVVKVQGQPMMAGLVSAPPPQQPRTDGDRRGVQVVGCLRCAGASRSG